MNNSGNLNASLVDNVPLQQSLLWSFILWVVVGFANGLASAVNIYVFMVWKPMQRDTSILVVQVSIMELIGSIILTCIGSFHVYYAVLGIPESRKMINCWLIVCWDMLTETLIGVLYMELSIDRFIAGIFPIAYQNRSKHYIAILSVGGWIFTLIIYFCSLIAELTNDVYVAICLLRYSLGYKYFAVFSYNNFTISLLAVISYLSIIVILKCQVLYVSRKGGNVSEMKKRMHSKVSKALALSALMHLLTYSTAALGTQLVTYFLPFGGGTMGPFFNTFYHLGSLTSLPIYCIFQQSFRQGVIYLTKHVFMCKCLLLGNGAVTPITTNQNHH